MRETRLGGNDDKILLGLGLAGLGYFLWREGQHRSFREQLGRGLAEYGLGHIMSDLGRNRDGSFVWRLTVHHPVLGLQTLQADIPAGSKPYSDDICAQLVQRVARYFGLR